MSFPRVFCAIIASAFFSLAPSIRAEISKGHRILLERGLQIQGLVQPDNYFHLDTFTNANYTSLNFIFNSTGNLGPISTFVGDAPGFPWSRWVSDETNMAGMGFGQTGNGETFSRTNELPFTNQLVSLQLGDEWNLNDDATRNRLVNWFSAERANWPNTILYHNNWGGQIADGQLSDFINRAQPDMICFDTYPWQSVWDTNAPNHTGDAIPGPGSAQLTDWFGYLRQDRAYSMASGIPLAIYRHTWHGVQDYDQRVFRDPSPSELRLNTFGAMAFGAKFFIDFTYNTSAGSLFTKTFNGSGDSVISTNGLYAEITDVNLRARNLGKALLRLKPVPDLHNANTENPPPGPASDDPNFVNGYTTGVMFLRGKYVNGGMTNFSPVPNSFQNDPSSSSRTDLPNSLAYTWWEMGKYDPFLVGFSVTNTAAVKNNGLHGDAIVAWFTPLDESMDGPDHTNEVYMMVVNALTDPTGSAADCFQQIKLNFLSSVPSSIVLLNSATGQLGTNSLPILPNTGGRRQLVLGLNGGDAALFKFNTGAPFVGFYTAAPKISANIESGSPAISIEGTAGSRYRVESTSSLDNANWTTLTNFMLPSSTWIFHDTTSSNASNRFYRVVGVE